jgi:hypothetical protein
MDVAISWTTGDAEGSSFALYVARTLLNAGSHVSGFAPMLLLGEQRIGISISGSERKECEMIASAFNEAGLGPVDLSVGDPKPDGSKYILNIFIGYRAPPFLLSEKLSKQ